MTQFEQDLEVLRRECFRIESGLECFYPTQPEPMTDEQAVRHRLYLIRCEIEKASQMAKRTNVDYSYINNYPQ